jgi:hypothetical protein
VSLRRAIKGIGKAVGAVARVVAPVTAGIPFLGAGVGAAAMIGQRTQKPAVTSAVQGAINSIAPSVMGAAGGPMSMLPSFGGMRALPGAGAILGAGAVAVRGAGAAMRGATAWCRRNPAWCAQIGGTAAIAGMIESGQLPMPRRRRGRGISSRDLRSYRRVHNLLSDFCAPKARIRKQCR